MRSILLRAYKLLITVNKSCMHVYVHIEPTEDIIMCNNQFTKLYSNAINENLLVKLSTEIAIMFNVTQRKNFN